MRSFIILGSALALSAACGRDETPRVDSAPGEVAMATAPALGVPPRFTNLACEPASIGSGDVLTMRFTGEHGPTMMAIAPDSTQYMVVFHGEGTPDRAQRKSFAPPEAFARTTEVSLDPRLLTAGPMVAGRDTNELLFTKPGVYRLLVGSDFESDGPSYAECLVRYAP